MPAQAADPWIFPPWMDIGRRSFINSSPFHITNLSVGWVQILSENLINTLDR